MELIQWYARRFWAKDPITDSGEEEPECTWGGDH